MTSRPLVTFALVAYNQERYIREAVEGALAQTYEPLEVILSDDCSTDRTFALMEQLAQDYVGPHRIVLNRNATNLGLCGHVNRVFSLATADVVVLAAGDDVSLPNRVSDTADILTQHAEVSSVSMQIRLHRWQWQCPPLPPVAM